MLLWKLLNDFIRQVVVVLCEWYWYFECVIIEFDIIFGLLYRCWMKLCIDCVGVVKCDWLMLQIIRVLVLMNGLCGLLCLNFSCIRELKGWLEGLWLRCCQMFLLECWIVWIRLNILEMFWMENGCRVLLVWNSLLLWLYMVIFSWFGLMLVSVGMQLVILLCLISGWILLRILFNSCCMMIFVVILGY